MPRYCPGLGGCALDEDAKMRTVFSQRILEELGAIRETLLIYPRRQGQRQHPTASCLTRMSAVQHRLFRALDLQRYAPAAS